LHSSLKGGGYGFRCMPSPILRPQLMHMNKAEKKIKEMGGWISDNYNTLKRDVDRLNYYYFDVLYYFGLTDNIDIIIESTRNGRYSLQDKFIEISLNDMDKGKISEDVILSSYARSRLKKLPPEKKEDEKRKTCVRALTRLFNQHYWNLTNGKGAYGLDTWKPTEAIVTFRKALKVAQSQITINASKFLKIYQGLAAANESNTKIIHQEAADAINRFFNGLNITQEELSRYFILEHGIVKPNPESINPKSYSRLEIKNTKEK